MAQGDNESADAGTGSVLDHELARAGDADLPVCGGAGREAFLDEHPFWSQVADDLALITGWGVGILRHVDSRGGFWVTFAKADVSLSCRFDPDEEGFEFLPWPTGKKDWTLGELAKVDASATLCSSMNPSTDTVLAESDRGIVIASAEAINEALVVLLKGRLPEPIPNWLIGKGRAGDLSRRIDVAHAAGLLPKMIKDSLDIVAQLRNDVAHSSGSVALDHGAARNRLGQLPAWRALKNEQLPPRVVFVMVVGFLVAWLEARAEGERIAAPPDLPPDTWSFVRAVSRSVEEEARRMIERLDHLFRKPRDGRRTRSSRQRRPGGPKHE
jgi:hypothetical protein